MKVRLLQGISGKIVTGRRGSVHDVPKHTAEEWQAAGIAEIVGRFATQEQKTKGQEQEIRKPSFAVWLARQLGYWK